MIDKMFKSTARAEWRKILCIDPGVRHLGFAFWRKLSRGRRAPTRKPSESGLINSPKGMDWEKAVYEHQAAWLVDYITALRVKHVVIEGVEFWGDSERSTIAAKKGDLIRLAFLVGALGEAVYALCDRKAIIVKPTEWKGTMPKDVMEKRVRRALRTRFKKHEYDGVAIGLRIMGKL
jgi:Holliday junction resolvasome RuvABC endonuclease subunit